MKTVLYQVRRAAIGQALRAAREHRKLSQDTVSIALGVRRATLGEVEAGRASLPAELVVPLSRLYGCDPRILLGATADAASTTGHDV